MSLSWGNLFSANFKFALNFSKSSNADTDSLQGGLFVNTVNFTPSHWRNSPLKKRGENQTGLFFTILNCVTISGCIGIQMRWG